MTITAHMLNAESFTNSLQQNIESFIKATVDKIVKDYADKAFDEVNKVVRAKVGNLAVELLNRYEIMSDGRTLKIIVHIDEPDK